MMVAAVRVIQAYRANMGKIPGSGDGGSSPCDTGL